MFLLQMTGTSEEAEMARRQGNKEVRKGGKENGIVKGEEKRNRERKTKWERRDDRKSVQLPSQKV